MKDEETLDELRAFDLKVVQPRDGYRFSLDPLLLCDFVGVRGDARVIDLGTGCGIIPLLLARRCGVGEIVGADFQEEMAALARRNVLLNGLAGRIEIVAADILSLRERFAASSFDLVAANPPYRKSGTGRISPRAGRDKARHETTATLADFLQLAKYLVKPAGTIAFIYHPLRLAEVLTEAAGLKLAPLRLRMVHDNSRAPARMVLLELAKGRRADLHVQPPLFVRGEDGGYSEEMKQLLGEKDA